MTFNGERRECFRRAVRGCDIEESKRVLLVDDAVGKSYDGIGSVYVGLKGGGSVSEEPSIRNDGIVWGGGWFCWFGVLVGRCQNTSEFWTFQVDLAEGVMRINITQEPRRRMMMNGVRSRTERREGRGAKSPVAVTKRQVASWRGRWQGNETPLFPSLRQFGLVWVYSVG